ncbi:MAG: cyclic pyranopterin monophosphate synthase MoaC [Chloroflexota bacterium]|nr:cyclic pyranopterin monophosphate synthase MoaC [Chloroflexota bacterium]
MTIPKADHDEPTGTGLSHFNAEGGAHMVDVGRKPETRRVAVASGRVRMRPETATVIREGRAGKGDVLGVAQIAGIMATKRTADLIPLCHPLPITHVDVSLEVGEDSVAIRAEVETWGKTGVEMEALTAVSATALTVYDMTKAIDRGMTIEWIRLESKEGGRSGRWERADG